MVMEEALENCFPVPYRRTKYQFARESKKPVAGMIRYIAQKPFPAPKGVLASNVTPIVITAKDKNNKADCRTDAFH